LQGIIHLEEELKPREPSPIPPVVIPDKQSARLTRGVDVSLKYAPLLSRSTREEKARETNQQSQIAALEPEVESSPIYCLDLVCIDVERTCH
jgi:hypothetical protein